MTHATMADTATTTRRRPPRLAQRRGILSPRKHAGHTLAEYADQLAHGRLDRRVSWLIYQVEDEVWLVIRGKDKSEHVLGHHELTPRRFKSCPGAMNALREALGVTAFAVEASTTGKLVPSRSGTAKSTTTALSEA